MKIVAPFPEQLSGVARVKIVQGAKTITLQLTLQKNLGILDMVNTTNKSMMKLVSVPILRLTLM